MHPERQELVQGVKMAAVAVVSAVVTAATVIGVGHAVSPQRAVAAPAPDAPAALIRTAG